MKAKSVAVGPLRPLPAKFPLRVKPKTNASSALCVAQFSVVLNCWSTFGPDAKECGDATAALQLCMQNKARKPPQQDVEFNAQLKRLGPKT